MLKQIVSHIPGRGEGTPVGKAVLTTFAAVVPVISGREEISRNLQ